MDHNISLLNRRLGVIINYTTLFLVVLFFELIKLGILPAGWIWFGSMGILVLVLVISFAYVYVRTGLWAFTHKKSERLDERELQLVTQSIRVSYSIFTVTVILLIYLFVVFGLGPLDAIIAAMLLYLAHILPTSILAWNEKEV